MGKSLRFISLLMFLTVNLGYVKCQSITTVAATVGNSNSMENNFIQQLMQQLQSNEASVPTGTPTTGSANSNEMTGTTAAVTTGAANSNEVTLTTVATNLNEMTGTTGAVTTGAANSNEMTGTTGAAATGAVDWIEVTVTTDMEYQSTGTGSANSNEMTGTTTAATTGTVNSNEVTGTTGAPTTGAANSNEMSGVTTAVPMTTVTTTGAPSNPACPVQLTTLKINVPEMLGTWFTIESYPQVPIADISCEFSNITYVSPNSFRVNTFIFEPTLSVSASGDLPSEVVNSYLMTVNRNLSVQNVDVQCTSNPNIQITNWAILAANFEEYAIHYACAYEDGQIIGQRVHILCRNPNPSSEIMAKAYKAMESVGLSTTPLVKISQNPNTCKQFPEYQNILE